VRLCASLTFNARGDGPGAVVLVPDVLEFQARESGGEAGPQTAPGNVADSFLGRGLTHGSTVRPR
jgi:hypothetical protein